MITIENMHFRSKQDFHLELSPIGNLKSFMSGPPVAKETLVLISTIHRGVAQLGLTISTIHRRMAQMELTISTIHRRVALKELIMNLFFPSQLDLAISYLLNPVSTMQCICGGFITNTTSAFLILLDFFQINVLHVCNLQREKQE